MTANHWAFEGTEGNYCSTKVIPQSFLLLQENQLTRYGFGYCWRVLVQNIRESTKEFFIPKFNLTHIWSQLSKIITSCSKLLHFREYSSQNSNIKKTPTWMVLTNMANKSFKWVFPTRELTPMVITPSHGEDYFHGLEVSLTSIVIKRIACPLAKLQKW